MLGILGRMIQGGHRKKFMLSPNGYRGRGTVPTVQGQFEMAMEIKSLHINMCTLVVVSMTKPTKV